MYNSKALTVQTVIAEVNNDVLIPEVVTPVTRHMSVDHGQKDDKDAIRWAKVLTPMLPGSAGFDLCGTMVRAFVDQHEERWFVGMDVLKALGLTTGTAKHYMRLDSDEKALMSRADLGLNPGKPMTIVSESGLYSLIFRSRKPEAKRFKNWVCKEVLPSIRKNGGYITPQKTEEYLSPSEAALKWAIQIVQRQITERETLQEKTAGIYVLKLTPINPLSTDNRSGDLLINRVEQGHRLVLGEKCESPYC